MRFLENLYCKVIYFIKERSFNDKLHEFQRICGTIRTLRNRNKVLESYCDPSLAEITGFLLKEKNRTSKVMKLNF